MDTLDSQGLKQMSVLSGLMRGSILQPPALCAWPEFCLQVKPDALPLQDGLKTANQTRTAGCVLVANRI